MPIIKLDIDDNSYPSVIDAFAILGYDGSQGTKEDFFIAKLYEYIFSNYKRYVTDTQSVRLDLNLKQAVETALAGKPIIFSSSVEITPIKLGAPTIL